MQTADVGSLSQPPARSRNSSMGADTGSSAIAAPSPSIPTIQPPPAYVATAAASQLVTDAHLFALQHAEEPLPPSTSHESAVLSPGALSQVNAFLDHLLYRFLAASGSPRFNSLKGGVETALRGKLGKLAMASAQAELEDLLAEGEDEELAIEELELQSQSRWDTETFFRRTRLRVMVYMRLGEMEDEDEEEYLEGLGGNGQRLGDQPENEGLVSWAGAIFLTSILEFIAEECLKVAGQSAYKKAMTRRIALNQTPQTPSSSDGRIYVTEADLDKAGLDARLGRHWRSWKHKMRVPFHERNNSSGLRSGLTSRKTSISTMRSEYMNSPHPDSEPPLPITNNDSQDLGDVHETPTEDDRPVSAGHQEQPSQEDAKIMQALRASKQRPASLNILSRSKDFDRSDMTPELERALLRRLRAQSLPSPGVNTASGPEFSPVKNKRHSTKGSVSPAGPLDELEEQSVDAPVDEIEAPPRSPLPNPLSAHPVSEFNHGDEHEGTWLTAGSQRSSAGRTRAAEVLRPSPTDTARSDNSPISAGKRDTKESQYSTYTSSKTSLEEGVDQMRLSKVRTTSDQQLPRGLHSSKAMRQDSFPRLDTSYQTAPSSPSTSAISPHPSRTSSKKDYQQQQQQPRSSIEEASPFTWFRKTSNASKRSRSSSKATQNDLQRPSKETLETTASNGSRNSRGETIQERPFSELIADREMIKLKLTPKQLQKIEEPEKPAYVEAKPPTSSHEGTATAIPLSYASAKVITPTKTFVTSPWSADQFSLSGTQKPALQTINSSENVKPAKKGFLPREARLNLETGQVANSPMAYSGQHSGHTIEQPFTNTRSSSRRSSGENLRSPPPTKDAFSDTIPPLPIIETRKPRTNHLPREATVAHRSPNADLIDFLRAGPPPDTVAAKTAANAKVQSQSSASPTLTSSSSRLNGVGNTRSSASPSNRTSSVMTQSIHGSVNSHTWLLPQGSRGYLRTDDQGATPAYQSQHNISANSNASRSTPATNGARGKTQYRNKDPYAFDDDEEDGGISALPPTNNSAVSTVRGQHRSKDPYAIPSDDEFEDELRDLEPLPKPRAKKEESFVDFLRNVEPPPRMTGAPPSSRHVAMAGSNAAYVDQGYQSHAPNKLKKEKNGSIRTKFFGKKVPS